MTQPSIWARALGVLLLGLTLGASAVAEPPSRAARLGELDGTVSFSPAGHPDWVRASVNRPLTTGDRLWTAGRSRAELQIGGAAMRIGPSSSVTLLRLDNRLVQLQLTQGVLRLRVRSLGPRQYFEIATPNLALTVRRPGDYRIEVDPADNATTVLVRSGDAEVYGEGASYRVDSRRGYRFYDTGLADYDVLTAQRDDDFDRWSRQRDQFVERSVSARYVSTDVVGYTDLDAHGSWRSTSRYGHVWTPSRVPAGWSPYRDGHWAWVDPWGWTWIDDARWGYAVSHYGRWAHLDGAWAWVPGPRSERAVYAPALVAFIGGSNFQVSITSGSTGAVGWFPLAPREVYQPSYAVSREYFTRINRSNAVITPQIITQVYNTTIVNNNTTVIVNNNSAGAPLGYANRQVSGAVVAVPTQAFVQSQPVARSRVQVAREVAINAPVARVASVAPVAQSVQGGREAADRPPQSQRERRVVARTALPPPPVAFAAQAKQLAAAPGRPIDPAARAQLAPAPAADAAPQVSVVASAPAPAATALPPATPAVTNRAAARRGAPAPAAEAAAPVASAPAAPDERQGGPARRQGQRPDAPAANAEAQNADAAKAQAAQAQAEAAKAAQAKEQAAKAEQAKADTAKGQAAKAEAARGEALKAEAAKVQAARAEEAKAEAARSEAARAAAVKAQATQAEEAKADAAQAQAATAQAARADAEKAEANRGQAAKAEQARAEAAKAQAARAEAAQAEAAKAEATKAEASKAAAAKAQADKAEQARAEAAKAQAARAEATRADGAKAEAAKAQAAKADEARAEVTKAQAARPDAAAGRRERRGDDAPSAPGARASGPDDGNKRGRDEPGKR